MVSGVAITALKSVSRSTSVSGSAFFLNLSADHPPGTFSLNTHSVSLGSAGVTLSVSAEVTSFKELLNTTFPSFRMIIGSIRFVMTQPTIRSLSCHLILVWIYQRTLHRPNRVCIFMLVLRDCFTITGTLLLTFFRTLRLCIRLDTLTATTVAR